MGGRTRSPVLAGCGGGRSRARARARQGRRRARAWRHMTAHRGTPQPPDGLAEAKGSLTVTFQLDSIGRLSDRTCTRTMPHATRARDAPRARDVACQPRPVSQSQHAEKKLAKTLGLRPSALVGTGASAGAGAGAGAARAERRLPFLALPSIPCSPRAHSSKLPGMCASRFGSLFGGLVAVAASALAVAMPVIRLATCSRAACSSGRGRARVSAPRTRERTAGRRPARRQRAELPIASTGQSPPPPSQSHAPRDLPRWV